MTLQELKAEATRLKEGQDFQEALPLYIKIWDLERNEWNGYRPAQCHRKIGNFDEAKEIYEFFDTHFPTFKPIQNEKLWLTYTEKIKDWQNSNLIEDAEILLSQTNHYDKYTGSIFIKTVLRAARHLRSAGENQKTFEWLLKLDQSVIANTVFTYQGTTYAADRKVSTLRQAGLVDEIPCFGNKPFPSLGNRCDTCDLTRQLLTTDNPVSLSAGSGFFQRILVTT
ncbi:MAG: hypothetical protein ACOYXA_02240 [Bacteroidota bacterium]